MNNMTLTKKDFATLFQFYCDESFDNMSCDIGNFENNICYDYTIEIVARNNLIGTGASLNDSNNILLLQKNRTCMKNIANLQYKKEIEQCRSLKELKDLISILDICDIKKFAKNTVFADGNENARYMLIGEAPGEQEDIQGIPFCGRSGKLLRKMLKLAKYTDDEIYFSNILFWRPPSNRTPSSDEIQACMPFVEKHIHLLNPEMIILIGNTAAVNLLNSKLGITMLRKRVHQYKNDFLTHPIKSVAIFHPSYILRNMNKVDETVKELINIKVLAEL